MFDAGWSDADDNTKLNPDHRCARPDRLRERKNVGVLFWNEARALAGNLEQALDRYAAWGARGIMVDFMDRDDQTMLRFQERVARAAAKRRLFVNLHGVAKPTGLQRAYPNLLTREAVLGHEYNMWSERATPDHALTVPFVRMLGRPDGLGRRRDAQRHAEDLSRGRRTTDEPGHAHAAAGAVRHLRQPAAVSGGHALRLSRRARIHAASWAASPPRGTRRAPCRARSAITSSWRAAQATPGMSRR